MSTIIREGVVNNKLAQLVLKDDGITVDILYGGVCIDSSAGGTWSNIKDTDLIDAYLSMIVDSYIQRISGDKAFEDLLKEMGWK